MKLSREKINHLTNLVVKDIEECEDVDFLVEPQELRMNVLRAISNELIIDDEIEEEVRRILSTYSSRLVEGSRDWEILFNKHYDQEGETTRNLISSTNILDLMPTKSGKR